MNYSKLKDLREKFGDSFYLLNSQKFSENYYEFLGAFRKHYPKSAIGFSYKTNYTPKLCKLIDDLGGYAEVVSEMEYDLAVKLGVAFERIIVNGPYKPEPVLRRFMLDGATVNLDTSCELECIERLSQEYPDRTFQAGLRCNFDIGNNQISRFGFDVYSPSFDDAIARIAQLKNVSLSGIHCHFPDRNADSYLKRAEQILSVAEKLFDQPPKYIDIGGGYFGKMPECLQKQFASYHHYDEYANKIGLAFKQAFAHLPASEQPELILEPGSALVADTMQFVSSVLDIKAVNQQAIANTSGSKFNIGLLTSSVSMPMQILSEDQDAKHYDSIDIAGFTCIESDYLYKGYQGKLSVGDFVLFENVGSYSVVFKPPFILPNVPVLELCSDEVIVVKRQETVDDIFRTFVF